MTRGRRLIGILLIVSLLSAGAMQSMVRYRREELVPRPRTASRLAGIDTFTLGLILGGLRGPLVMILWISTETQKNQKDLESIDTKIELILRCSRSSTRSTSSRCGTRPTTCRCRRAASPTSTSRSWMR